MADTDPSKCDVKIVSSKKERTGEKGSIEDR